MKKIITCMLLIAACHFAGYAQCDKKVLLTSSKTEYLNPDSSVQKSVDEQTTIEFDKSNITIAPGNEDRKMAGTITSYECNWQTPFKEGKTELKVALAEDDKKINLTITIKGKEGKISFLVEMDNNPNKKLRLAVDKFEEKS